jgi:hypothetical protein
MAERDTGAIELVCKKAVSMPEEFTLRAGEAVPFSAFLASDTLGVCDFFPFGDTMAAPVLSAFVQDGVIMLRGEAPGVVQLEAKYFSRVFHITITVTE